jgi:hypothetical protein
MFAEMGVVGWIKMEALWLTCWQQYRALRGADYYASTKEMGWATIH